MEWSVVFVLGNILSMGLIIADGREMSRERGKVHQFRFQNLIRDYSAAFAMTKDEGRGRPGAGDPYGSPSVPRRGGASLIASGQSPAEGGSGGREKRSKH
jgi:hypothetical protein